MATFDEEREEERIGNLPQHVRDDFQPDGMSAPPEGAPPLAHRQAGDPGRQAGDPGRQTGDPGRQTGDPGRQTGDRNPETREACYRENARLRRRLEGARGLLADIRAAITLEHINVRPESARLWAELAGRIESVLAREKEDRNGP